MAKTRAAALWGAAAAAAALSDESGEMTGLLIFLTE
jgi:hypothetical protein